MAGCQKDGLEKEIYGDKSVPALEILEPYGGDYSSDSLQLLALWEKYGFFDNHDFHDSAILVCRQVIDLGVQMLEFRFDSSLYEKYAKAYGGIGWNLMGLGQLDEALAYSKLSLKMIDEKFGPHIRSTEICVGIAYNFQKRGEYDQAIEYIHKSLHIMNQVFKENHYYFGNNYNNLGTIYRRKGDFPQAIKYFEKALGNWDAYYGYGASDQIEGILELAKLEAGQGNEEAALEWIGEAMKRILPGYSPDDLFQISALQKASASNHLLAVLQEKTSILWSAYLAKKDEKYLAGALFSKNSHLSSYFVNYKIP